MTQSFVRRHVEVPQNAPASRQLERGREQIPTANTAVGIRSTPHARDKATHTWSGGASTCTLLFFVPRETLRNAGASPPYRTGVGRIRRYRRKSMRKRGNKPANAAPARLLRGPAGTDYESSNKPASAAPARPRGQRARWRSGTHGVVESLLITFEVPAIA